MRKESTKLQILVVIIVAVVLIVINFFVKNYLDKINYDYQTMSDISQIRSGLALSFSYNNYYPKTTQTINLNDQYLKTEKLCNDGFKLLTDECKINILSPIPRSSNDQIYKYTSTNDKQYFLEFNLMHNNKNLKLLKGLNCVNEISYNSGPCFSQ